MNRIATFLLVAFCLGLLPALTPQASGQGSSATSKAQKRLEELLQPRSIVTYSFIGGPVVWPGPKALEQPQLILAVYMGDPPKPLLPPAGKPAQPRLVPEAQPPVETATQPELPKPIELPTQPLIRLPSADAQKPLPLPILAKPKQDRAPLDDTTLEASQAAALKPITPKRTQPVPFVPLNLPDPFEHVRIGGLRHPPEENAQPPAIPVQTPRP